VLVISCKYLILFDLRFHCALYCDWQEKMMAEPLTQTIFEKPAVGPMALSRLRSILPEGLRGQIRSARELDRELREAAGEGAFPTAVPVLDRLLDGGLPRGQLVELVGSRTSGRFSLLLAALAAVTGMGEAAALVDLGDGLDPETASGLGVDLERLLWVRPARLKEALAATEMLIDGGFPLVALDLGAPPVRGGRGVEAAWLRLARAARAHDAALLVGSPYRVSGTAAATVLKASPGRAAWQGGGVSPCLLDGFGSRVELEKCRGRLPGQSEDLRLTVRELPRPAAPQRLPARSARPERAERQEREERAAPPRLRIASA
jgi:NAD(P)H-dependent FMN reductase